MMPSTSNIKPRTKETPANFTLRLPCQGSEGPIVSVDESVTASFFENANKPPEDTSGSNQGTLSHTVTIRLTKGQVAVIDAEDYDRISQFKWSAQKGRHTWYGVRRQRVNGKQVTVMLHRFIVGAADDQDVDHRDGDGLNNRRSNLRPCTQSQNHQNTRCRPGSLKGVYLDNGALWNRFRAQIYVGGKLLHLGQFEDEIDAALAYDEAAREHFGEFANCNFCEGAAEMFDQMCATNAVSNAGYPGKPEVCP